MGEQPMTPEQIQADMERWANEPVVVGVPKYQQADFREQAKQDVAAKEAASKEAATPKPPPESPKDEPKAEATEEKQETADSGDRPRDEKGRFLPKTEAQTPESDKTGTPDTPDSSKTQQDVVGSDTEKPVQPTPTDTKPESNYEKAKKEHERQKSVLADFDEKQKRLKEEIKREREELARERENWRQQAARGPKTDVIGYDQAGKEVYSSASLWKAALDFEREGQDDMAKMAREAIPASQRLEAQQAQQMFEQARNRVISEVVAQQPELSDATSPAYKEMASIYEIEAQRAREHNRKPLFDLIPDFMPYAAEVTKLRLEAASKADLQQQLATAQEEIRRLNGKLQVNGSSPTQPPSSREFKDLTTDQQLDLLDKEMKQRLQNMYR